MQNIPRAGVSLPSFGGPKPAARGHRVIPAAKQGGAGVGPDLSLSPALENVPRFPIARRAGLHPEQQNLRDHQEPADGGGGHGVGQRGRGAPGHHHEGQ